jgi:hypothetical protein
MTASADIDTTAGPAVHREPERKEQAAPDVRPRRGSATGGVSGR